MMAFATIALFFALASGGAAQLALLAVMVIFIGAEIVEMQNG